MSILVLLLILAGLALAAWFFNTKIPAGPIRTIANVVLVVIAVLVCLSAFGVLGEIRGAKVPQL